MKVKPLLLHLLLIATVAHGIDIRNLVGGIREQRVKAAHDHGASTGTVTEVTKEQEAAGHAAMTCDYIMAKSVVLANEQKAHAEASRDEALVAHKKALAKIATMEDDILSINVSFATQTDELAKLKQASAIAERVAVEKYAIMVEKMTKDAEDGLKSALGDAELMIKSLERKVNDTQADANAVLEGAKAEWNALEAELKKDTQIQIEEIQNHNLQNVADMQQDHAQKVAELQREATETQEKLSEEILVLKKAAAAKIDEITSTHNDELEKKNVHIANIKAEANATYTAINSKHEATVSKLVAEKDSSLLSLQAKHDKEIVELKAIIEGLKSKAKNDANDAKVASSEALAEAKKNAELTLEATKSAHVKVMTALTEANASLENKVKMLQKQNSRLEHRVDDIVSKLANWEQLHGSRSYCNLTHIQEDTTAAIVAAASIATEKVGLIAGHATTKASVIASHATKLAKQASEPHLQKTRVLYDLHLREHVDKHVSPHLNPIISTLGNQIGRIMKTIGHGSGWVHQKLINTFRMVCSSAHRELKKRNAPDQMVEFTSLRCQQPRVTVDRILQALLVLVIILYRKSLWQKLKFLLHFPVTTVFSPFRYVFTSKRIQANSLEVKTENDPHNCVGDVKQQ